MKKTLTTIIIGLLLLLPAGIAQDAANGDANPTASQADATERCSELTKAVREGDSFTFCHVDITIEEISATRVIVNGKTINLEESQQVDSIEITYDEYSAGEALITLSRKAEKKLKDFDEGFFKLFYGEDATFLGTADAGTEKIAEITYGTNKAYIRIRSSTPKEAVLGIDFENEDKSIMEKLHLSWKIHHMEIQDLVIDKSFYTTSAGELTLFSGEITDEGKIILELGDAEYTIELLPLANNEETNAIVLHSEETFNVYNRGTSQETENLWRPSQETEKLWITTKLAKATAADKSCKHSVTGSSLDDFTKKSSVQGMYPAVPSIFLDVFTDYCKDETTIVNYGCVGLDDAWDETSRVSFLEATCPSCIDGACTSGPYCIETDKHAPDEGIYAKGKLKILERGTPTQPHEGYDNGMKRFVEKALADPLEDTCEGTQLKEYHCDPDSRSGFSTELVKCPEGTECKNGACLVVLPALPTPPTPECTSDAECTNPDKPICSAGVCTAEAAPVPPECTSDAECTNPDKPICSAGVCTAEAPPEDFDPAAFNILYKNPDTERIKLYKAFEDISDFAFKYDDGLDSFKVKFQGSVIEETAVTGYYAATGTDTAGVSPLTCLPKTRCEADADCAGVGGTCSEGRCICEESLLDEACIEGKICTDNADCQTGKCKKNQLEPEGKCACKAADESIDETKTGTDDTPVPGITPDMAATFTEVPTPTSYDSVEITLEGQVWSWIPTWVGGTGFMVSPVITSKWRFLKQLDEDEELYNFAFNSLGYHSKTPEAKELTIKEGPVKADGLTTESIGLHSGAEIYNPSENSKSDRLSLKGNNRLTIELDSDTDLSSALGIDFTHAPTLHMRTSAAEGMEIADINAIEIWILAPTEKPVEKVEEEAEAPPAEAPPEEAEVVENLDALRGELQKLENLITVLENPAAGKKKTILSGLAERIANFFR